MNTVDDIIFRYHRLNEAYDQAIARFVKDGEVIDVPKFDEVATDFAFDFTELLHELVAAMYASDNPPHPTSLLEATRTALQERHRQ